MKRFHELTDHQIDFDQNLIDQSYQKMVESVRIDHQHSGNSSNNFNITTSNKIL